jgi:hypothetical protein
VPNTNEQLCHKSRCWITGIGQIHALFEHIYKRQSHPFHMTAVAPKYERVPWLLNNDGQLHTSDPSETNGHNPR